MSFGFAKNTKIEIYDEDFKLQQTFDVPAGELWASNREKPGGTHREITKELYIAADQAGVDSLKSAYAPRENTFFADEDDPGCSSLGRNARLLIDTGKEVKALEDQVMIHVGDAGLTARGNTRYLATRVLVLPETPKVQNALRGDSQSNPGEAFRRAFVDATAKMQAIVQARRKANEFPGKDNFGTDTEFD